MYSFMNFWTFWTVFMVSETLVFRVFLIKIGKGCSEIVENLKKHRIILPLQGCSWILVKFLSFLSTKKRVWIPNTMPTRRKVAWLQKAKSSENILLVIITNKGRKSRAKSFLTQTDKNSKAPYSWPESSYFWLINNS